MQGKARVEGSEIQCEGYFGHMQRKAGIRYNEQHYQLEVQFQAFILADVGTYYIVENK